MTPDPRVVPPTYSTTKLRVSRPLGHAASSFYDVFRLFFDAFDLFLDIFSRYEERLLLFCEKHRCDRNNLIDRLSTQEVSGLFDFEELSRLRLDYLRGFQELSDRAFLNEDSGPVKSFLLHIRHLYHLVSILTLEELNVSIIAPGYVDLSEEENLREILREVDRAFPSKLREIRSKFEQSFQNLNAILPENRQDKVFVRSIYLFERERLVQHYGDLDVFYLHLYPTGVLGGLRVAAESFLRGGFTDRAREVVAMLAKELDTRGREFFAGREGVEGEWKRFRTLQLELAQETDGTALV